MTERRNLNIEVQRLQREGRDAFGPMVLTHCEPNSREALLIWQKFKPEVYGIGAILTDPIMKSAYEMRDTDRIVDQAIIHSSVSECFSEAGKLMLDQISPEISAQDIQMLVGDCDPKTRALYMRLTYLLHELAPLLPTKKILRSVENFMHGGANTGCGVTSSINGVIGQLLLNYRRFEAAEKVSWNSHKFSTKLGSDHVEVMDPTVNALRMPNNVPDAEKPYVPFDPILFQIKGDDQTGVLDLSEIGKKRIDEVQNEVRKDLNHFAEYISPQTGCLARAQVNGVTTFRLNWLWNHEIASEVYRKFKS